MIPFTQYMRPNGRKVPVEINRPPKIEAVAKELIAAGFVFEIEHTMSNSVVMYVTNAKDEEDLAAIEVCPNGPEVPEAH